MKPHLPPLALPGSLRLAAGAVLLAVASMATAQYKVVGPDGKVTYTDRSPSPSAGQVTSLSGRITRSVDFEIRAREIVGFTGLVGMGHGELPYLIVGQSPRSSGTVVGSASGEVTDVVSALEQGIVLVPADRARHALQIAATAEENLTLPVLNRYVSRGVVSKKRSFAVAQDLMSRYGVRPARPSHLLSAFSGGNQQKISIARWLQTDPEVLLLDEPTQGVDAGSRKDILDLVVDLADRGTAVGVFSSDLQQLAAVCHRVYVMNRGRSVAMVSGDDVTEERLFAECTALNRADAAASVVAPR